MMTPDFVASVGIWTGGVVGLLKVVDWLLSDRQKKAMAEQAVNAWVWLESQRAGRFTELLRSRRTQQIFVLITHAAMAVIVISFLLRVYLDWRIQATLELGHPRIYRFQVWIDVAAVALSAFMISLRVHPRIAEWIASAPTLPRYFGRAAKAMGKCYGLMLILVLVQYPIIGFSSPAFDDSLSTTQMIEAYEDMLGGKTGVVALHALIAFISAPVLAEAMMSMVVLFLSFYWLVIVYVTMGFFKVLAFAAERIAESRDGPVLALSGLLIGLGALAKAALGK